MAMALAVAWPRAVLSKMIQVCRGDGVFVGDCRFLAKVWSQCSS